MLWTLFIIKTCLETAGNKPFKGKFVEIMWKFCGTRRKITANK